LSSSHNYPSTFIFFIKSIAINVGVDVIKIKEEPH
jgi:hypothetical protein